LALKAPLASPALTGVPTAPTASTGTNNTQLATTAFVETAITGVPAKFYQSPQQLITFTTLSEIIAIVAPAKNAVGLYSILLQDGSGNELDIIFSIAGNFKSSYNYSTINIIEVNDTSGVINNNNISNYILLRGYFRSTSPNTYFAVTLSTPNTTLYSNPLIIQTNQDSFSLLSDNTTITSMIGTDVSNLVSLAPADLIFKMKVNIVPVTTSIPQGYAYCPSAAGNAIYQYSLTQATGNLFALSPATFTLSGAYKVAATTLRNYVYATATGSNNVFMQSINPATGVLAALGTPSIAGPNTCTGITVDPTDRFVYVCGFGTGQFGQYSITKATGQLVAIASPPTAAGGMQELVVHPSGKWLYAINNTTATIYQYAINSTTGALTALGTPTIACGTSPVQIAAHPNGNYVYVANSGAATISMYSVNTTTGQLTALSPATFSVPAGIQGVTISNNGLFVYYGNSTTNLTYQSTINPGTGLISTPTTSQATNGARFCTFDFSGTYLNVVNNTAPQINIFSINQTTGAHTPIGTAVVGSNCNNIILI